MGRSTHVNVMLADGHFLRRVVQDEGGGERGVDQHLERARLVLFDGHSLTTHEGEEGEEKASVATRALDLRKSHTHNNMR